MLQIVAWVMRLIVKKNTEGILTVQNNKDLAVKDLKKIERITLKNLQRKALEDGYKIFTNIHNKDKELGDDKAL